MLKLKKGVAVLAVVGAIIGAGTPVTNAQPTRSPHATASCTRAIIGGKHKCIGRGQYCTRRYQRDYKRYGFSCSRRDRNGRYHLR